MTFAEDAATHKDWPEIPLALKDGGYKMILMEPSIFRRLFKKQPVDRDGYVNMHSLDNWIEDKYLDHPMLRRVPALCYIKDCPYCPGSPPTP